MLINHLLVNLCILIALIFVYVQLRWKFKIEKKKWYVSDFFDGVAGGLLGIILMYYSIQITNETIVDLRFIPVMLLTLFVGIRPAMLSGTIIIVGRFLYGVTLSAYGAMVLMILIMLFYFIISRFLNKNVNLNKKSSLMILATNIIFTVIITVLVRDFAVLKILVPSYWGIAYLGGFVSVFFVDFQRKSHFLLERYKEEASIDYLTGLNNVRQFDHIFNMFVDNAKEKVEKLSLLTLDIDFFKKVNDTYGHPAGDKILIELGQVLKNNTRSFDIVSRNGGEEFSVILPDCPNHQAMDIAERIRESVSKHSFPIEEKQYINITVSIGVATYPETVQDPEEIVKKADKCLYVAKQSGRNRVSSICQN